MKLEATKTTPDRKTRIARDVAFLLAFGGLLHFIISLLTWALFYLDSYRQRRTNVLTVSYSVKHLTPAIVLLGLFGSTCWVAFRRRIFALPLLACSILLSVGLFAVDVLGEPQFQHVWFDEPSACSNRQSYYCT